MIKSDQNIYLSLDLDLGGEKLKIFKEKLINAGQTSSGQEFVTTPKAT